MTTEIKSSSVEYVRAAVAANRDDVHSGTVEFAFTSQDDDDSATWVVGEWFSSETSVELVDGKYQDAYIAQVLFGIDELDLEEGTYFEWLRVTLGSQEIVKAVGKIKVT